MKKKCILTASIMAFAMLLSACGGTSTSEVGSGSSGIATSETGYTIIWKNYDGAVLETDRNVKEGTLPTYDGATPTKPEDSTFTYEWSGWDPAVVVATADATYTATYTSTPKDVTQKFTITWKNDDDSVIKTTEVTVNEMPSFGDTDPVGTDPDAARFYKWVPELVPAVANATYTASYSFVAPFGFENGGENTFITKDKKVLFDEIEGTSYISLKANTASTEWYLEATVTRVDDLTYHNIGPESDDYVAATWNSIGIGAIDENGKVLHFEPELASPLTIDEEERNTTEYEREVGVILNEAEEPLKKVRPFNMLGDQTKDLYTYNLNNMKLGVYRSGDKYHCYLNDQKMIVFSTALLTDYSSAEDFPALLSRSIGVTFENVSLTYTGIELPEAEWSVQKTYDNRNGDAADAIVDVSKAETEGTISFAANRTGPFKNAMAVYNATGSAFGFKAHYTGFGRTADDYIHIGVISGRPGASTYCRPDADPTTLGHDWGNPIFFSLANVGGVVKVGFRTLAFNPGRYVEVDTVAWNGFTEGYDFDLEIIWNNSVTYGRFAGYNSDGTEVVYTSQWIKWDLTANGYFGPHAKGAYMSPLLNSWNNTGAGVVSDVVYLAQQQLVIPSDGEIGKTIS